MQYLKRRPTKKMIETLRDCHEKEILGQSPCGFQNVKNNLSGLIVRGYMSPRYVDIDSKKILCFFVTDEGKKFLQTI